MRPAAPGIRSCCAGSPPSSCCSPPRPPKARAAATCARAIARWCRTAALHAHQERDRGLLRRAGRRHRHHGAPRARRADDRSGAGRGDEGGLRPRSPVGLGHARHARHLQRRLQARGSRRGRADPARAVPEDSRPHRDAGRAPHLERGVDRDRGERGRARPGVRAQGGARQCGPAAARRGAPHPRERDAARAAGERDLGAAALRDDPGGRAASWRRSTSRPR